MQCRPFLIITLCWYWFILNAEFNVLKRLGPSDLGRAVLYSEIAGEFCSEGKMVFWIFPLIVAGNFAIHVFFPPAFAEIQMTDLKLVGYQQQQLWLFSFLQYYKGFILEVVFISVAVISDACSMFCNVYNLLMHFSTGKPGQRCSEKDLRHRWDW